MSETAWTFEKKTTKSKPIAFRLDDEHSKKLESQFTSLDVNPKKEGMTEKMLLYIDRVEKLIQKAKDDAETNKRTIAELRKTVWKYEEEKRTLDREAQRMVIANRIKEKQQSQPQPPPKEEKEKKAEKEEPPKSEAKTSIQMASIMPIVKVELKTESKVVEADPYSFEDQCQRKVRVAPSNQANACEVCKVRYNNTYESCKSRFKH
jgi:hypothetical protein